MRYRSEGLAAPEILNGIGAEMLKNLLRAIAKSITDPKEKTLASLPAEARYRVQVKNLGDGVVIGYVMKGSVLVGLCVMLDTGEFALTTNQEVSEIPP